MFSDIRGFTSLVEDMSPEASFQFVNEYYQSTEPSIYENNGFVDHYFGDGVMAIFPKGAASGLKAAIDFLISVERFNQKLALSDQNPIKVGIGLHIGEVVMGVCGGQKSIQCTVIGDCVNLAARLEGLSSRYQTALVISHDVYENSQSQLEFQVRALEYVRVKGRVQPVEVYEVLDVLSESDQKNRLLTKSIFERGVEALRHQSFDEAKQAFEEVLFLDHSDHVASLHLKSCMALLDGEILIDDQGASILKEK